MNNKPASAQQWLHYYERNAGREDGLPWDAGVQLEPALHRALTRTLQRFNLGESGEGRWLKQWAAQNGDADYCAAIELFVAEEQAHSRWFGRLLGLMGEPVLQSHWSDAIFTRVRRAGGLYFELVTFLTAEIVGKQLFAGVAHRAPNALVAAVFRQIVKDESAHIAFHIGTLRVAFAKQNGVQRLAWRGGWSFLLLAAMTLVCLDHAPLFRELGISRGRFALACWRLYRRVAGKIWQVGRQDARRPATVLRWD